jgi:hypothetical protein
MSNTLMAWIDVSCESAGVICDLAQMARSATEGG